MLLLATKCTKQKRADALRFETEDNVEVCITETFLHEVNKWKEIFLLSPSFFFFFNENLQIMQFGKAFGHIQDVKR